MAKKKTSPTKKRPRAKAQRTANVHVKYSASLYCSERNGLPKEFVERVRELEGELGKAVWLVVQSSDDDGDAGHISEELSEMFISAKETLGNKPLLCW